MSTTNKPNDHAPSPSPSGTAEPKVLLEDLTAGLIWPTLLKAPSMAFAPARWLLGTLAAFTLVLAGALHTSIFNPQPPVDPAGATDFYQGFPAVFSAMMSFNPYYMINAINGAINYHLNHFAQDPWTQSALYIPCIFILGIFGFAITRSTSIQFGHGRHTDTAGALSASFLSIRQIALTTLGPLAVCAILASIATFVGLLLGLPVVNILGAALYLIPVLISILIVCLLTLHLLTLPISISALAIEGTDAFDALQRAYAYIIAKPIRLFLYTLLTLFVGTTIVTILAIITGWSIELADQLAAVFTNDAGRRVLMGDENLAATEPLANRIINLIRSTMQLLVAGFTLSLVFTSSTLIYLAIRRVCDGQDMHEIWDPEQR